jgi:Pyruvate/2-oxoacid:ferredoxin oxidoreductase delta subunit
MSHALPVYDGSLAVAHNPARTATPVQMAALALVGLGLLALVVAWAAGGTLGVPGLALALGVGGIGVGTALYAWERFGTAPEGVRMEGTMFSAGTARGHVGWAVAVALTAGYVLLYWWPETLAGLIAAFDPIADFIGYAEGVEARRWVMYGTLYTLAVAAMGARALLKYRHSRYHIVRTLSVVFFQTGFGFAIPYLMVMFDRPEFYFHYFWPLKYDYAWPGAFGWLPVALIAFGLAMIFVVTPVLTYFFGKRWYCSWVCGCGALAETAGDPYRHLSDKSTAAWRVERWMVHGVLVFVLLTTALLWINSWSEGAVLGSLSQEFSKAYGFAIGLVFAGVVGVGFYPIMGARVWCRFGCPMAAVLGLQQRFFSRFRITTNGGQCISCGQCSAYCEMGIDVRSYAQRGQSVVRASCVGCGICATVCPRGVLRLENGRETGGEARAGAPTLTLIDRDLPILTLEDER